jgi:hypothetical protein
MMNFRSAMVFSLLVGCSFLAPSLLAQGSGRVLVPPGFLGLGGGAHAPFDPAKIGEPDGWSLVVSDSGIVDTLRIAPDDFFTGSLVTSVTVPRDYCVLPAGILADAHLLVLAGQNTMGQGVLEVVQVDAASMALVLLTSTVYPGLDILGVAFDPYQMRLALLDGANQAVMDAPWVPGSALPSVAMLSAWDMSGMPAELFARLSEKNLTFVDAGHGFPPSSGQLFVGLERNSFSTGHFLVPGSVATAYEGTWFNQTSIGLPFARSDNESATSMLVQGAPGQTVEVVRLETGAVVGQVLIPVSGWQFGHSFPCPLVEPLHIGDSYVVRYSGTGTNGDSTRVLCVARYGMPGESLPSGLTVERVEPPRGAYLGNADFDVRAPLSGGAQTSSGYYTNATAFLSALRDPGGIDPILPSPWGGNPLLSPVSSGFVTAFIFPNGCGSLQWRISLPNDPAFVGEVLLAQFLLIEPGAGPLGLTVAASETVGVRLHVKAP